MEKSIEGIIQLVSHNETIMQSFLKTKQILSMFERPMCSISGGKDSDIMLDMITKLDDDGKVRYVFFDTGIEYKATRQHLVYLEEKYGLTIDRQRQQNQYLSHAKNMDNHSSPSSFLDT